MIWNIFRRKTTKKWISPRIKHLKPTKWLWTVSYPDGLDLGEHTDIGAYTYINAKHGISIGNGAQIGSHCSIYTESTIDGKTGSVIIEPFAKVGAHSTIMPGIQVGAYSTVAAHSFVNKDVPACEVWGGVPIRRLSGEVERRVKGFEKKEQ